MDTNTATQPQSPLALNEWAKESLGVASKWARFLAIVGFIACGFMLLMALFAGALFSSVGDLPETKSTSFLRLVGGVGLGIMYALIAILYFFPCLYLYKFSDKTKTALFSNNEDILANAMDSLKKMFKFLGWMTIIMLSLYGVLIVCIVILGMMGGISR
jgi:hypothetical protein